MGRISTDEVRAIGELARLELDETEVQQLAGELDGILGYIEKVQSLDTDGVEPLTHAVPFDSPLRPDVPEASFSQDEALANAPKRDHVFFGVPKVVSK